MCPMCLVLVGALSPRRLSFSTRQGDSQIGHVQVNSKTARSTFSSFNVLRYSPLLLGRKRVDPDKPSHLVVPFRYTEQPHGHTLPSWTASLPLAGSIRKQLLKPRRLGLSLFSLPMLRQFSSFLCQDGLTQRSLCLDRHKHPYLPPSK